jgi:hypothetical protein
MENIKAKIDEALQEVEANISTNPNLALTKARLLHAREALDRATNLAARSSKFGTRPPVIAAPVKKKTVPQVVVPGATNIVVPNPATIPTEPTLTEEIFNKSSPKQIVADFGDDAVKAFATSISIPFTDNEDAMLIASRVKKHLKTKPDAE